MPEAENRIHVELSPEHAFERWADPEQLSAFLEGLRSVRVDGQRWHFVVEIDGGIEEWDSTVELDRPHRISWRDVAGRHFFEVTFTPGDADEAGTWVDLRMEYQPALHDASSGLGVTARSVAEDLRRFRVLVEEGPLALARTADPDEREGPASDYVATAMNPPVDVVRGRLVPTVASDHPLRRARAADPADFDDNLAQFSRLQTPRDVRKPSDWSY